MSLSFWETLLRPDQEEKKNPERTEIARAANFLEVGEFQLLQLAYREWHHKDLPETHVDRLFNAYMLNGDVPHWARHYARRINLLSDAGRINEHDPRYHRYDHNHTKPAPHGVEHFALAVGVVVFISVSGFWFAQSSATRSVTLLPPYFTEDELKPQKPVYGGFGRADTLHPRPGP